MSQPVEPRNPGPSFGYRLMRAMDPLVPEALFRPLRALGTWVAVAAMPAQRRHSRAYLALVLDRPPRLIDVFRHFFAFTEFLMLKLRVVNGRAQPTRLAPDAAGWEEFMQSGRPALLGSLHLGHSDLLGFLFGHRHQHRLFMVRQRVGNSHDTDKLLERFGDWLEIIWVNDPANLLFALKDAVDAGGSIAMKCDRLEFAARTDLFHFLGARRRFPVTIYHLALIFHLPVVLSFGLPGENGESVVHSSPVWRPDPQRAKAANLAVAREHFQSFLRQVEAVLRAHPYQWFNFIPLDPAASA